MRFSKIQDCTALILGAALLAVPAAATDKSDLVALIRDDFDFAAAQYAGMLERLKDDPQLPRTFADRKAVTVSPRDWTSGQSWGLYGFVMMYRETRDPLWLAQARKIAGYLVRHPRLPADKVPYWDYDAPGIPDAPRDASAAAIMCSALLELSGLVEPDAGREYRVVAEQQLRTLSSASYRAQVGANGNFLIMHGVGHLPRKSEVDQPLIYADYYFLEALLRLNSKLAPAAG